MSHKVDKSISGIVKSLGLVFGDIGTSPIYTFTVIFLMTEHTHENIIGVSSLIIWTLILLVTVQYAWLVMSLGKRGEGGTIVLREILVPLLRSNRQIAFVTILSFIGVSLLIDDGVITPAISILSAMEGMLLIPGFENFSQNNLILIAALIAFILFAVQKKGTEKVAGAFGPLMVIWFLVLGISGFISIIHTPLILKSLNPYYGIRFLLENGLTGFFVLSEVTLCATGCEALYADMGHLGREPIIRAWNLVFVALLLNYFGQGAFLIQHPGSKNILFEMVFNQSEILFVPFLVLCVMATIIASQAMISGLFSIIYQGITTRILPMLKIDYTSKERQSQIYIGFVNWFLLLSVIFIMIQFRASANLAAAYGLAVTGTMTITGIMMTWIFMLRKQQGRMIIEIPILLIIVVYFLSNTYKIPHGGYLSVAIAAIPFGIILLYREGQRKLYQALQPLPMDIFLLGYREVYEKLSKIKGSALFFARAAQSVPPYIVHTMIKNNIIYEDNIIVSVAKLEEPFGVNGSFTETLADGLRVFEIRTGYMEMPDVEEILRNAGINEKVIFYGVEDISTSNVFWQMFSIIKKLTPNIVQFYKLPANKLHGVVTRIEM